LAGELWVGCSWVEPDLKKFARTKNSRSFMKQDNDCRYQSNFMRCNKVIVLWLYTCACDIKLILVLLKQVLNYILFPNPVTKNLFPEQAHFTLTIYQVSSHLLVRFTSSKWNFNSVSFLFSSWINSSNLFQPNNLIRNFVLWRHNMCKVTVRKVGSDETYSTLFLLFFSITVYFHLQWCNYFSGCHQDYLCWCWC